MLFEDTGNGALIQLTDEEVVSLRLALRRLQEWHSSADGTGEVYLPAPDEIALATELKEKLYEVPLMREAVLETVTLDVPGPNGETKAQTVSFYVRRRDLE